MSRSTPADGSEVDRRQGLIDIATALFEREGYPNVGLRAIASEAGIRPASIYHHFSSKEELLYAICLEVTDRFVSSHVEVLDRDDPVASLGRLVELHVIFCHHHRGAIEVARREMRELSKEHLHEVMRQRTAYRVAMESHIAHGKKLGVFIVDDVPLTAIAVVSLLNSVNEWFVKGGRQSIETVAAGYRRLVVERMLGAAD